MRSSSKRKGSLRRLPRVIGSMLSTPQRGSVTAELAISFPLVIAVLVIGVGTLSIAANQLRLEQTLATALRSGSQASALDYLHNTLDAATITRYAEHGRSCLRVESRSQIPLLGQWFTQQAQLCFP